MSYTGRYVSLLAAGMEGREGRERICYDLSSCGGGAPPGRKRRLIRGGGGGGQPVTSQTGMVTVGVTVLADAGSKLPAALLGLSP